MPRQPGFSFIFVGFLVTFGCFLKAEEPDPVTIKDPLGDVLPKGASVRIGSTRLRHGDAVEALACSRDGKWLATYCAFEKSVAVWATDNGKLRCRLPVADVSRMAFTPDGNTLAVLRTTVHLMGEILVECWDLPAAVKVSRYRDEERYAEEAVLEFSPDGKYLCYGRSSLRRLDWARGVLAFHVPVSAGTSKAEIITAFAESADGTTLITAEGHNSIHFRDPARGNERCKIDGVADVGRLTLSTDGKLLALGNTNGSVELWQVPTVAAQQAGVKIAKRTLPLQGNGIIGLALSRDNQLLALQASGAASLWDVNGAKPLLQREFPACRHGAVAFADGQGPLALTNAVSSRSVSVWNVATGMDLLGQHNIGSEITCLCYLPGGRTLVIGSNDKALHFYKTATGEALAHVKLPDCPSQVDFDDGTLVVGGKGQWWKIALGEDQQGHPHPRLDGTPGPMSVWLRARPHDERPLPWKLDQIDECTVMPDGLLLDFKRDSVQVLESATGAKVGEASRTSIGSALVATEVEQVVLGQVRFTGKFKGAVLAPNRYTVAVVQDDTGVVLDELLSGKQIESFLIDKTELVRGQPWLVLRIALAPGGRMLGVGTPRGTVLLYDLANGQQFGKLTGHPVPVTALAFAPDGKSIACAYRDTSVLLWDLPALDCSDFVGPLLPPDDPWLALAADEAVLAWKAHWEMVKGSKHSVAYLRSRLQPAQRAVLRPVAPLVQQLNNPKFTVRQQATKDLEAMGKSIEAELRAELKTAPNLETQRRLESLLAKLEFTKRKQMQELRGIAVLEQIGDSDATFVLETLATGDPEAPLTRAAQAAYNRRSK